MLNWTIEQGSIPFDRAEMAEAEAFWSRSAHPSPFASPPVLAHLAQTSLEQGATPIFGIGRDRHGKLAALWPLVETTSGRVEFLQRRLCDHGTALYRPDVGVDDLAGGLAEILSERSVGSLFLNNLPSWDRTREATERALAVCGWNCRSIDSAADPVLAEAPGEGLEGRLAGHVHGRSLRNYANRLRKSEGYAFEVLEDDSDLARWAAEFCDCHDWRWAATATPSNLASPQQRAQFEDTLRAWDAAGTLVRFAVRLAGRRIAFAVVLRAGNRLIYHRIAHSPAHSHTRASTVLIRNLILWMADHNETTLDFGLGDEQYKYRFATHEERLWRVYGAQNALSRTWAVGALEASVRSSLRLQVLWDRFGNRWARGQLPLQYGWIRSRSRQILARLKGRRAPDAWRSSPPLERIPPMIHEAPGKSGVASPECEALPIADVLGRIERSWPLTVGERLHFYERHHAGWIPHCLRRNGASSLVAWLWSDPDRPHHWWVRSTDFLDAKERPADTTQLLRSLRALAGDHGRVFVQSGGPGGFETAHIETAGFRPLDPTELPEDAE